MNDVTSDVTGVCQGAIQPLITTCTMWLLW